MDLIVKIENMSPSAGRAAAYDGEILAGESTFSKAGDTMLIIDHTEVTDGYQGKGDGALLVKKIVDYGEEEKKSIIPLCPFAKKEFDKHPEYRNTGK